MPWHIVSEAEQPEQEETILNLVARSLGGNWTTKSSHQLRLGNIHDPDLSLLAYEGDKLVGTVRLWPIVAGDAGPALLLGPLAIDPPIQGLGLGQALLKEVIKRAKACGHGAIVLVGDAPYYERVGFSSLPTWLMRMPGRYDQNRLQAVELKENYLSGKAGVITREPVLS